MKSIRVKAVVAACGAMLGLSSYTPAGAQTKASPAFKPGIVLVKYGSPAAAGTARNAIAQGGFRLGRTLPLPNWQVIELRNGETVANAVARLKATPGVVVAEPDYILKASTTPNDAQYINQYALTKIGAPSAWEITQGAEDIVVGVSDSGILLNHEDLRPNLWVNNGEIPNNGIDDDRNGWTDDIHGVDAYDMDSVPNDENGHGTHVAGIIGAVGNNGVGVSGVNWRVKLMALRHLGADGFGTASGEIECIDYAIRMKKRGVNLRVINHSYGFVGSSTLLTEAFERAADAGIINICAAGNGDIDGIGDDNDAFPFAPANIDVPGNVSVAAAGDLDEVAPFSNFGARTVDIAAPGVDILSTYTGSRSSYREISGTSMASPYVAGAAALLLARAPGLSPEELKSRLLESVEVLPQWQGKVVSGGRLNLANLFADGIYAVRGRITTKNAAAKPLVGARIFIGDSIIPVAFTDKNGEYRVAGLNAGTVQVRATMPGYNLAPSPVSGTLSRQSPALVANFRGTSTGAKYGISGQVFTQENGVRTPVRGVSIYLNSLPEPVAVSDAQGRYSIITRPPGEYTIRAAKAEHSFVVAGLGTETTTVALPATGSNPNATVNFRARVDDTAAPIVAIRRPLIGDEIPQGANVVVEGRVTDATAISYASIEISTAFLDRWYNWRSQQLEPYGFESTNYVEPKGLVKSADFTMTAPNLPVGQYYLWYRGVDTVGNIGPYFFQLFTVIEPPSGTPNWPKVLINSPTDGQEIPAGPPVTVYGRVRARGADAEAVLVRLVRYDAYGRIIGFYDWNTGQFVSDQQRLSTYTRVTNFMPGNETGERWVLQLPALPKGDYQVIAFGRDIYGNEAPPGGSYDAHVFFKYGGTTSGSAGSVKLSAKEF